MDDRSQKQRLRLTHSPGDGSANSFKDGRVKKWRETRRQTRALVPCCVRFYNSKLALQIWRRGAQEVANLRVVTEFKLRSKYRVYTFQEQMYFPRESNFWYYVRLDGNFQE